MKKFFAAGFFCLLLSLSVRPVLAETFEGFCAGAFTLTKECPIDLCSLHCSKKKEGGCDWLCLPKHCEEIKLDNCPIDYCVVLNGCDGKKTCFTKPKQEAPGCGDVAYPYQDVPCCEGLRKRCGVEFFDGSCDMEGKYSEYSVSICLPCGNGICNQFEDRCNCPEDCKKLPPEEPKNENIAVDAIGNVEKKEEEMQSDGSFDFLRKERHNTEK